MLLVMSEVFRISLDVGKVAFTTVCTILPYSPFFFVHRLFCDSVIPWKRDYKASQLL